MTQQWKEQSKVVQSNFVHQRLVKGGNIKMVGGNGASECPIQKGYDKITSLVWVTLPPTLIITINNYHPL